MILYNGTCGGEAVGEEKCFVLELKAQDTNNKNEISRKNKKRFID